MTTIQLNNMAAKYLVDYVTNSGWSRGYEDVYRGGQLLAEVLPRFIETVPVTIGQPPTVTDPILPVTDANIPPVGEEITMLDVPIAPVCLPDGNPDWSKLSKVEADDFRGKIRQHNSRFSTWCRTPIKSINLTDKQLDVCQRAIKYYGPRSDDDKKADRDKGVAARPEIPNNEYTYLLLKQLKLAVD